MCGGRDVEGSIFILLRRSWMTLAMEEMLPGERESIPDLCCAGACGLALTFCLIWNKFIQTFPPAFPSFLPHQFIPWVSDAACLCSPCHWALLCFVFSFLLGRLFVNLLYGSSVPVNFIWMANSHLPLLFCGQPWDSTSPQWCLDQESVLTLT